MRIRTFAFIMSMTIISIIGMTKIPANTTHSYCVEAEATRSRHTSEGWVTDFTDEHGNIWCEILEERPHLYGYVLVVDDNGTPYDVTDDVVEKII